MNALPTLGSFFLALAFGLGISISPALGATTTNTFQRGSNLVSFANTNLGRLQSTELLRRASRPATNTLSSTSTNAVVTSTNRAGARSKWLRQVPVTEQGASVRHTRLPAWLSPNLNVQEAIRLRLPDGSLLKSTVVGLGYYDTASGTSVVLATVKDSGLEKLGLTQFIYRDAFQGVKADVRYRFGDNFFEQDVILREQPRSPSEWGLNPDTTLLEVLTETYSPPAITTETNALTLRQEGGAEVKSADESLRLGGARIVRGQAFELPTGTNTTASAPVPVAKSLVETEGRKFLIEAVDYRAVEVPIQRLPARSGTNSAINVRASTNRLARALPASAPTVAGKATPRLAGTATSSAGFVLDYIIVGESITNTVWVEDAIPAGPDREADAWTWITNSPTPVSGSLCHQQSTSNGIVQHYFAMVSDGLSVNGGDILYCWVYLDPTNPPTEVMLQWNDSFFSHEWMDPYAEWEIVGYDENNEPLYDWVWYEGYWYQVWTFGTWEHRAYWGGNQIEWGEDGTASRRYMGPLPPLGQWVRLEVPASVVELEGAYLTGMAFTQFGGKCAFDYAGKLNESADVGWVNDAVPAGAIQKTYADTWTWITNNPAAQLGTNSHRSIIATNVGFGQHWFEEASSTLTIGASNALYCWVFLNPTNRPNEIMLQWSYGEEVEVEVCDEYDEYDNCISSHWEWIWQANWEHRAFWGADLIHTNHSRVYMGPLPPTNGWVRLEVPASKVNLEGRELYGMAFAASPGTVTWDNAGVTRIWSTDRDGDGLEDEWEIANALNPWLDDRLVDSDGDGVDDLTEVLQGRDPHKGALADTQPQLVKLLVFPSLR